MKNKLLLLFAVLAASAIHAQQISDKDKIIYLDSLERETTNPEQVYFRVIKDYHTEKEIYKVINYYKSGKIKNESTTKDKESQRLIGKMTEYYENGNKETEYFINDDYHYEGTVSYWYESGKPKIVGEYFAFDKDIKKTIEQPFKVLQYWDTNNVQKVKDGNGEYIESDKSETASGKVSDGLKDGVWKGTDNFHNFTYTESYDKGVFVSGVSLDSGKAEHNYTEVMERPNPKGGLQAFYQFIARNYRTPEVSKLKGKVFCTFTIETDGSIGDIKVIRDIGYGTGDEAVRVLRQYKDFNPGKIRGILVPVKYSLPIAIQSAD
jgi:antitoxin component YwqK of YwqJK toxin-antitoxin module